ncbi:hypothetical protein BKA69DRAFT_1069212 [Paraphysoderma sedebokerense]|nr:hypothetical protein BKA69DRAFT_1069212 [Paraphysoderma sedebokerense]
MQYKVCSLFDNGPNTTTQIIHASSYYHLGYSCYLNQEYVSSETYFRRSLDILGIGAQRAEKTYKSGEIVEGEKEKLTKKVLEGLVLVLREMGKGEQSRIFQRRLDEMSDSKEGRE